MEKGKRLIFPMLSITGVLLAGACSDDKSEWILYGDHGNMNDVSRDYLINCLDDRGIEFKLDNGKNVLIQQRDLDMAAASCS